MTSFKDRKARRKQAQLKKENVELPSTWLIEMDGVLVDSVNILQEIYLQFLKQHGHQGNKKEFFEVFGMPLREYVEELTERYSLRKDVEILVQQYQKLIDERYPFTLLPGAVQCLQNAYEQGFTLCLLAPLGRNIAESFLKGHRLDHLFDAVIFPEIVESGESPLNLYYYALSVAGSEAEDTIAIVRSRYAVEASSEADLIVWQLVENASKRVLPSVEQFLGWSSIQERMRDEV